MPPIARKEKTFGPPSINMPGTPASPAVRKCGTLQQNVMDPVAQCPKCAFDLDACNSSVGSKLKCPLFVASEMSGFKVVPSPFGLG